MEERRVPLCQEPGIGDCCKQSPIKTFQQEYSGKDIAARQGRFGDIEQDNQWIQNRNGLVEMMRFFVCVGVVLMHSHVLNPKHQNIATGGALGVDFFFVLSGFLMTRYVYLYSREQMGTGEQTARFIWKKVTTIFPVHAISFLFAFLVREFCDGVGLLTFVKDLVCSIWEVLMLRTFISGGTYPRNDPSWYVSMMIIVMLVIFPIIIKYYHEFVYILAPLLFIFIGEWYCVVRGGSLISAQKYLWFVPTHFFRAVMGLSFGTICFEAARNIQNSVINQKKKYLLTVIEILAYLFVFIEIWKRPKEYFDLIFVLAAGVAITLTFSGKTALAGRFDKKICYKLGHYSLFLFYNHFYWLYFVNKVWTNISFSQSITIYLLLSVVTSITVMKTVNPVSKLVKGILE